MDGTHGVRPDRAPCDPDAVLAAACSVIAGSGPFESILAPGVGDPAAPPEVLSPDVVADLHVDALVGSILDGYGDHGLESIYLSPLHDADAVAYRQEVMRDVSRDEVARALGGFSRAMRSVQSALPGARAASYAFERERATVDAMTTYCEAVTGLARLLACAQPGSRGLLAFRAWLDGYVASDWFQALAGETRRVLGGLSAIRYGLILEEGRVTVCPCEGEEDYAPVVAADFERFGRGAAGPRFGEDSSARGVNHVQSQILERLAILWPEPFRDLEAYAARYGSAVEGTLVRFAREVNFYLAYVGYVQRFEAAGYSFCFPVVVHRREGIWCRGSFDPVLAERLMDEGTRVVTNDFSLAGDESMAVVTGPNQGGKTTFARMLGQLHVLAALGCPVPGSEARVALPDRVYTHFEREERLDTLRGKLEEDLHRVRRILESATADSLVILNELFSSTTLADAVWLGRRVMDRLAALGAAVVFVTFLDELASFGPRTVSIVGTLSTGEAEVRSYEFVRRPADGLAYALGLAERHRLTRAWLGRRLGP